MPMYDFVCTQCGVSFEDITDGSCPACPKCGSQNTERCLSAPWLKTNPMPFKIMPPRPQAPKIAKTNEHSCGGGCAHCSTPCSSTH